MDVKSPKVLKPTDILILNEDYMDEDAHIWETGIHFEVQGFTESNLTSFEGYFCPFVKCIQVYPHEGAGRLALIPPKKALFKHHTRASYLLYEKQ